MRKISLALLALSLVGCATARPEARRPTRCEIATQVCPHGLAICSSTGTVDCYLPADPADMADFR